MQVVRRALAIGFVALGLFVAGCEDDECMPVEDLAGAWRGTWNADQVLGEALIEGPDSGLADGKDAVELVVEDEGNSITAYYSTESGLQGVMDGLQQGSLILFEAEQSGSCAGTFDGRAEVCGNRLTLTMSGDNCEGKAESSAKLTRIKPKTGECKWKNDGECDEPQGTGACASGSDPIDCTGVVGACVSREDGTCDEPEGTGKCPNGTDVEDCRGDASRCTWRDDGVCDEPQGTGLCGTGEDPDDCAGISLMCPFTNNGFCDELHNGGSCPEGSDFNDCNLSCPFTNDGFCDEVQFGGSCPTGSDFNDCLNQMGCPFTNDGFCDEFHNGGSCPEGTDFDDCNPVAQSAFCDNGNVCNPIGNGAPGTMASVTPCCMPDFSCGVSILGGQCSTVQPVFRGTCPVLSPILAPMGTPGGGCCREEGICGVDLSPAGIAGCASPSVIPLMLERLTCSPGVDEDAGVP